MNSTILKAFHKRVIYEFRAETRKTEPRERSFPKYRLYKLNDATLIDSIRIFTPPCSKIRSGNNYLLTSRIHESPNFFQNLRSISTFMSSTSGNRETKRTMIVAARLNNEVLSSINRSREGYFRSSWRFGLFWKEFHFFLYRKKLWVFFKKSRKYLSFLN